jgi:hypothetical protein
MRKFTNVLMVGLTLLLFQVAIQAQTTGSISGAVTDPNGAFVPGANIVIKGEGGQEFRAVTNAGGTYSIPAIQNGTYTVTVSVTGFKTSTVTNVKVDVGTPRTVDVRLELGNVGETVEITGGGEVLQTQTATVGSTVTGRQITETPIASRDALDLIALMPGTNTVGAPRRSSINGLPKGSISITIDGVDVQDNLLRSSDGFFTYVRPRVDAIEEVTVSTAASGAETGGDGAVQIKFVTKRGTNDYNGSAFYQRRHESMNSNYWFNNRDNLARSILRLQQYGASFGGPIPFLGFGEDAPVFNSGKDKRYFFVNYEEFRLPDSLARTRTILTEQARQGIFTYLTPSTTAGLASGFCIPAPNPTTTAAQMQCQRNVYDLVANVPGALTTPDPTIAAVLTRIRQATGVEGTIRPIPGATTLTTENYSFSPKGNSLRKFLATRFDFNVTKKHSLEFVMNRQDFGGTKDFLNNMDERFPGFPFYNQQSKRNSYAIAARSSFGQSVVNEFRIAMSRGFSQFAPTIKASDFDYTGGFLLGIDAAGATTPYSRNSFSARTSPTDDITDNLTWVKGRHTLNFGGQWKRIRLVDIAQGRIVPTIGFGLDASGGANNPDTALRAAFANSSTSLPGATSGQLDAARALYATLIGHVTSYASTALLDSSGKYVLNGQQTRTDEQKTYGLYAQDSWKLRPNLTVNFGLRWQPQGAYVITSSNYGRLSSFEDVYGLSGVGNLFKPGTMTGRVPTVVAMQPGERAYPDDKNNLAPSFGAVWSPNFGNGLFGTIFGREGKAVLRGGYSKSFVREGTALIGSLLGANPGGNLPASRTVALGNLVIGTNLRDLNNPNLTPPQPCTGTPCVSPNFSATPSFPITLTTATSANAFDPNLKTGSVHSFTFGYQREIDRNTVVELRYVGNRGVDLFRQHNLNELNVIENGLAAEYRLAQQNLLANAAAGRCQGAFQDTNPTGANFVASCRYNMAYFGPGSGTNPLPITVAYLLGQNATAALNPALYGGPGATAAQITAAANFRSTTFISSLNPVASSPIAFGANLEGNAGRRTNALNAGLPANFFFVNPTVATAGAFVLDNSARSWYDGGTIEVRRRMSQGLRVNASYTFAKAQSDSYQSNSDNFADYTKRPGGNDLSKSVAVFDIRHSFKFDATYDLPIGRGRTFFGNSGRWADAVFGGFTIAPVIRWQSGSPIQIGNAQLVGMTVDELQKAVKVRKEANAVFWLPDDIILNSRRAFGTNIQSPDGYGTLGAPEGRFLAPAGFGNCQPRFNGECGFRNLVIYGPSFFKFDASVAKRIKIGEKRNLELRLTALDVLNRPNFRVGSSTTTSSWAQDVATSNCCGTRFGQILENGAYQDVSTTNDPGGRLIDLMIRLRF